jgi:hypothetical protein
MEFGELCEHIGQPRGTDTSGGEEKVTRAAPLCASRAAIITYVYYSSATFSSQYNEYISRYGF